ncbi:hypothetical protein CTI14_71840, partial [Methylobacterium radiotolerans]
ISAAVSARSPPRAPPAPADLVEALDLRTEALDGSARSSAPPSRPDRRLERRQRRRTWSKPSTFGPKPSM